MDGTETKWKCFLVFINLNRIIISCNIWTHKGWSEPHSAQLNRGLITLVNICLNTTIRNNNIGRARNRNHMRLVLKAAQMFFIDLPLLTCLVSSLIMKINTNFLSCWSWQTLWWRFRSWGLVTGHIICYQWRRHKSPPTSDHLVLMISTVTDFREISQIFYEKNQKLFDFWSEMLLHPKSWQPF